MNEKKMIKVFGREGCIAQGRLWFVVRQLNILCGFNLSSMTIDKIEIIPYEIEISGEETIFIQLLSHEDYLYFIPMIKCGEYSVIRYSITTSKFDAFKKYDIGNLNDRYLYSGASMVGQKLYCVPWNGLCAYSYNFESGEEQIEFRYDNDANGSIRINQTVSDSNGKIYCTIEETDKVAIFNIIQSSIEIIELGVSHCRRFPVIANMGDNLYWFSNRGGDAVYKYDLKQKRVVAKQDIGADHTYLYAVGNKYLICDMGVERKYKIYNSELELLLEKEKKTTDIGSWYEYGGRIIRMNASDFTIEIFDGLNTTESYPLEISYKHLKNANKYLKILNCNENSVVGLEFFINNIIRGKVL